MRPTRRRGSPNSLDRAVRHDIPLSAFHFGSGYTSIGKRRYVFTWNRAKFPEPRAAMREIQAPERARGRQSQAMPARRPPGVHRGRRARRVRQGCEDEAAVHRTVLGRRGCAHRLHSSRRYWLVAGEPARAGAGRRHRRGLERQQRIRNLGRRRQFARLRAADTDRAVASPACAADDACHGAKRRQRIGPASASTPSRAPVRPASSATRRRGRETTRRAGIPCAGTCAWA